MVSEPPVNKAYDASHETEKVVIEHANIDKKIIPLVQWMNSFESARTLYCCEGEPQGVLNPDGSQIRPYVLFVCPKTIHLITILNAVNDFDILRERAWCYVQWSDYHHLRYHLTFADQETMLEFCENNEDIKKWQSK